MTGTGPTYFTVETKDGMTRYYGNTADSRIEAQGKTTVGTWALNRVEDAAGNYYAITYHEDTAQGAFYPLTLAYTGNDTTGLSPNVSVEFHYEDRPDTPVRFEGGAQVSEHPKRLANIQTYVGSNLVSDYRLTYELVGVDGSGSNPEEGKRSRLTRIDRCDAEGSGATCQDPVVLTWWAVGDGVAFDDYELEVPWSQTALPQSPGSDNWISRDPRWHDVNGDGTADYLHRPSSYGSYSGGFEVLLSGPNGYETESWTGGYAGSPEETYWADIDGDGRTDIITETKSGSQHSFHVSLSNGAGFVTQTWKTHTRASGWSSAFYFRDMNGDKRLDLLVHECSSCTTTKAKPSSTSPVSTSEDNKVFVYLNTGSGFGSKQTWANYTDDFVDLADMNGDGLTDLVENGQWVRLNDGSAFGQAVLWPAAGTSGTSSVSFLDYNADGKTDRLWHDTDEVYYNTGGSFVLAGDSDYVPYVDFSGDGQPDTFSRAIDPGPGSYGFGKANIDLHLIRDDIGDSAEKLHLSYPSAYDLNLFHQAVDVDGDGIYEYTASETWDCIPNSGYPSFANGQWCETGTIRIFHNTETHLHLLKHITTGQGAEVEFTYAPLTDHSIYTKYDTSTLPELDVQDGTQVVKTLTQPDGLGGSAA